MSIAIIGVEMNSQVKAALIGAAPGILWALLAIGLTLRFYRPVLRDLVPRIGGMQVFGIQLTFLQEGLNRVSEASDRRIDPDQLEQVARRAYRSTQVLQGAKILWVDDRPSYNNYERRFLNSVGVLTDIALDSQEAYRMLGWKHDKYDLIISDMDRGEADLGGQDFLTNIRKKKIDIPVIFYTSYVDPTLGIPQTASGITAQPDELMNLVMDRLERGRG